MTRQGDDVTLSDDEAHRKPFPQGTRSMSSLALEKAEGTSDVLLRWRKPGLDFDLENQEPTPLEDLLKMDGLFPLSRVSNRLPIPLSTLQRWSRQDKGSRFGSCFTRIPGEDKALVVLVDLVQLNAVMNAAASSFAR